MRFQMIAASALAVWFGVSAHANELDKETPVSTEQISLAKALPKTVIVRTKVGTNQREILQSKSLLKATAATKKSIASARFAKLDKNGHLAANELDQDSSSSSWYFWCNPYGGYYPNYNYYGYNYAYALNYSYYYGGYHYAYYRWPYWY